MSGAEAAAVLGLLSSIITIIVTAKELYEAANDTHGLPEALSNAETKLPLILMILKEAQSYTQQSDIQPDVFDAFERILRHGEKKANELLDILKKVLPKDSASAFDRYRSATRQLMKGSRVDYLMKALLEDMITMTSYFSCPTHMKSAVKQALEEVSSSAFASKDPAEIQPLREIRYNTYPSYSDIKSKQELRLFLRNRLLPENLPGACFESDHADFLKKRFQDTENSISTCEWVFQTTEYCRFIDENCASVLRIKGPSRCGKSVLLSAIIDRLQNPPSGNGTSRVLFCYARNGPELMSPITMARVLLAQVLQWQGEVMLEELHTLYSRHPVLQGSDKKVEKQLWRLIRTVLAFETEKINIIVDGLEECTPPLTCVQYLIKVASKTKAGILLSSRRDGRDIVNNKVIQSKINRNGISLLQLEMTKERIYPDLMVYVTHRVNTHDSFSTKSQSIRDKFIKGLCERADGMFLYTSLVMDDLKANKIFSARAVDATLADLPRGLFDIYRKHLELPKHTIKGPEILCWIYCSSSPLTWHELQSALAIGESGYDEDEIVDDSCEDFIEHSCGQLIESYGELERLRFIHPTVKEFLGETIGPGVELGIPNAHSMVATKLLTFLEYQDLPFFSSFDIEKDSEAIIQKYSLQCGRGLYSFATFNWYRHLKECSKIQDVQLEQHVVRFLMSPAIIRWLKSAIIISHATGYGPVDSSILTADVIHSLQTWMLGRAWSDPRTADTVQAWIKDFVDLMLDWGKVLETQADWIHYIHHQLIPEKSCFRHILEDDGDQSVIQFHPNRMLTKSSQIATWPDHCFTTDSKRDLAFTYHKRFISCYHMQTGLLVAEFAIPFSRHHSSLLLRRGVLCPQGKYIAAIFEVIGPWSNDVRAAIRSGLQLVPEEDGFALRLENPATSTLDTFIAYMALGVDEVEFVVCLLQLSHTGPARSQLFGVPNWATDPTLVIGKQSLRWELDDIDALRFSSDSSRLATPFGIFDLDSGEKVDPWSFALTVIAKGGKTTEDIDVFTSITDNSIESKESAIGFWGLEPELEQRPPSSEVILPGIGHLLASSNQGRFLLVLKVQKAITTSKSHRSKASNGQQGSIEIWDRVAEPHWTPLLILDPSVSGSRAPWDLSPFSFPSHFSPETEGSDKLNSVIVYVPPKWKLASNIRNRNGFDSRQAQLLLFEARKTGNPKDGFTQYPTLRCQLPADAFRKESASSDLRLTILSWSTNFESATVYANRQVISMTQDDMRKSALALMQTSRSKLDAEDHKDDHTQDYFALLFSADGSASFYIRISTDSPEIKHNALLPTNDQLSSSGMGDKNFSVYEIYIACVRTGEMEARHCSMKHSKLPEISYPPLNSQYVYAGDEEHITIGCLQIDLFHDYEEMTIEVTASSETVFSRALQCFKEKARPLTYQPSSSDAAPTKCDSKPHYTIFSQSEIFFKDEVVPSATQNDRTFLARGSSTIQEGLHLFEFSRRLYEYDSPAPEEFIPEAHQFELYLCIYDEINHEIPWLMHSVTAGEIIESTRDAPETAWALHPQLPLLVWLLPGHRLRLSNIESNGSPITIAESLMIEENSTQSMFFSPNGRYLALKAQESFKYAWMSDKVQSAGSVVLIDLLHGRTVMATPTTASNVSIDMDDEYLHVYNLTREGGVQSSSYQLPNLELKKRQYLTFIPADCCCSTCGIPIQETPNIAIIEHQGVKFVTLGHVPVKIGMSTIQAQGCEPLMLRITSPPVDLNLEAVYDALLTICSVKLFPIILNDAGELLADAFTQSDRTCSKTSADGCSCPTCRAEALPERVPKVYALSQMNTIMNDFKLGTGERIPEEDVERQLQTFETGKVEELALTEEQTFTPKDAKHFMGEEIFPWDSWDEYHEFMEEIKDEFDLEVQLQKVYDPDNRSIGCRIPFVVQTFSFSQGGSSPSMEFQWSSAMGVGWIEEDIHPLYRRMFSGSMAGTRRLYAFPYFGTLEPRLTKLSTDPSSKGQRFRRLWGGEEPESGNNNGQLSIDSAAAAAAAAPESATSNKEMISAKDTVDFIRITKTKKGKKLKSRSPMFMIKEGELWDPLLPINDVLDSISDVIPGMGDFLKHRMKTVMMQDMISGVSE